MNQTRDQREAAIAAELDADRINRQAENVRADIFHIAAMVLAAVLVFVAVLLAGHAPADAATHRSDYSVGENPRDIGDWPSGPIYVDTTWASRQWNVAKAVKSVRATTGLDVRVCRVKGSLMDYTPCGQITVQSDSWSDTGPTGHRLGEVSLWSTNGVLESADISLDDKDGKKAGAARRDSKLRFYVLQAVGR